LLFSVDHWVCMRLAIPGDQLLASPRFSRSFDARLLACRRSFGRLQRSIQSAPDNLAEDLRGLNILQTDIKVSGCLDVAMTEQPADEFIFAGPVLEENRRCSMAELMNCDPQSGGLEDPIRDLKAQGPRCLDCLCL